MPDFQRKTIPFLHRGLNWNAPAEKIPDGQIPWAKNVRVLEQGTISSANGHVQVYEIPGYAYLHTMSRLNVRNPAFNPNFGRTYLVGAQRDTAGAGLEVSELYVFQKEDNILNPALNPVKTPLGDWEAFSGNPLSVVEAQPAGAAVAWKYIGDSKQMVTVGYYPSDIPDVTMARALTIGLPVPIYNTGLAGTSSEGVAAVDKDGNPISVPPADGSGNLNGLYQWIFAFRRVETGARSNPSAAARHLVGTPNASIELGDHSAPSGFGGVAAAMTLPQTPIDPQTGLPDTHVVVDVYRYGGTVLRWALVGSGPGGSTFIDNVSDLSLQAAPSPPQATDPSTGLTRFNLFQPFVTQDLARRGNATIIQSGTRYDPVLNKTFSLPWILQSALGDRFNPNWLAGSTIYLNGRDALNVPKAAIAFTIYQVLSPTQIELAEDATHVFGSGDIVDWSINAGTLMSGQPLPHLWGVYGIGQSGSYLFGCGDANAPGTLYWTNGNDPDSTDVVNNIILTSGSERLTTGCIYNGQPLVWSTERMFQISPSVSVFGQFFAQEMASAKGCWLEWSLSVQSNGFADQSVTWRGKDGIYDFSGARGLQRLSDPLYAFFPHDNNPGIAPETIMPWIGGNSSMPEHVGNLDDNLAKYHRTCWFQGMLFYDFVAFTGEGPGPPINTFSTLVYDSVNVGGWVSLDQLFQNTTRPIARNVEIGADNLYAGDDARHGGNLKVTWGSSIFNYSGYTRGFPSRVITRAEDMGDPRLQKQWGDYWLDCTPLSDLTVVPLVSMNRHAMTAVTVPPPGQAHGLRNEYVLDFPEYVQAGGRGFMTYTLGLDIRWNDLDGQYASTLNQWQPSFVPKPEFIEFRASDRSDEGAVQAKYLMGMNMEANTHAVPLVLNVIIDGATVAQLTINHDGQTEHPYAWEPVAGYEFQVQMTFPQNVEWQLFKISWIFEVWPDAIARKYPFQNFGTSGAKYIKGIVMPMETGGQPGTVHLWGDDADTDYTWTKTTELLKKTGEVLDLSAPFVAHEIQFSTLTDCRIWPGEVKVDFDPWPEMSTDVSSFTNLGYQGSKFFQGIVFSAETGGNPRQITVNSDCGHSVTLPVVQTPALCKNTFAFSFSPCNDPPSEPFIASEVQIVPDGDIRIWNDETRYVWEPEPELVPTWQTQPTDHDLPGWHSMRDCYIAYRGGQGAPTLYITTEYGTESYLLDMVAPGAYLRCYRVLKPQKAKWRSYRVEGCGLFRLYMKDCEVRVKAWGSTGPYISAQPFGDLSRTNGGARI